MYEEIMFLFFNCGDKCLIYLVTCQQCNKQYTGETTDLFCNRWNNYKDNVRKFGMKESCMQEHLYKNFRLRVIKAFWMRRQLHLLIEQMEKIRKKEKDVGCEHWKQWNFMSLILQVVRSRLILYLVSLLIIIFYPLLFL